MKGFQASKQLTVFVPISRLPVPWMPLATSLLLREPYTMAESISKATSHEKIHEVLQGHSARVPNPNNPTLLYSGRIELVVKSGTSRRSWDTSTENLAKTVAKATDANIVNDTKRARLITHPAVDDAIWKTLLRLELAEKVKLGKTPAGLAAVKPWRDHLFGAHENSIWGRLSREYNESARGNVIVLAVNANPQRVLSLVEMSAALRNPAVTALGGLDTQSVQRALSKGDVSHEGLLSLVQRRCIDAAGEGRLLLSADNSLKISQEFATQLGLKNARLPTMASLLAAGYAPTELHPGSIAPAINLSALSTLLPSNSAAVIKAGTLPASMIDAIALSSGRSPTGTSPQTPHASTTGDLLAQVKQTMSALQQGDPDRSRADIHALTHTDSTHQMQAQAKAAVTEQEHEPPQQHSSPQTTAPRQAPTQQQANPTTTQGNSGNTGPHR